MNMISVTQSPITHAESAWIVNAVPLCLAIGSVLLLALLLRGKIHAALATFLTRRAASKRAEIVHSALLWTPPIASAGTLLWLCLLAVVTILVILNAIMPLFIALILAGPATLLLLWLLLWAQQQRYVSALDRALPAAVGRLGAQLRSGSGIAPALHAVSVDLPDGPLKAEWRYLVAQIGAPLTGGALATPQQVVAALAAQSPSQRHVALLGHLEVALGQTHDVLCRRVQTAYGALHAAEQRRSQASTELAQMRYSGFAIGLAGLGMAAYLALTQWERFITAYSGPLGLAAGVIVGSVLAAPFIGGFLLARADDLEY